MNILVIGRSGFVGKALVLALQRLGDKGTDIDRQTYAGNDFDEFIHADLLNQEATRATYAAKPTM